MLYNPCLALEALIPPPYPNLPKNNLNYISIKTKQKDQLLILKKDKKGVGGG